MCPTPQKRPIRERGARRAERAAHRDLEHPRRCGTGRQARLVADRRGDPPHRSPAGGAARDRMHGRGRRGLRRRDGGPGQRSPVGLHPRTRCRSARQRPAQRASAVGTPRVHISPCRAAKVAWPWRSTWRGGRRRLRVVVTHLGLRAGERRQQVERLLRAVGDDAVDAPSCSGDINEWWLWGRPLRWLHRRFGASPAPRTFPTRLPVLALDRVWVHPRKVLVSLTAVDTPAARRASDHLPVVATLRFPEP